MRVRPVDMNGDMMPIYESSQMLVDAEAVAQVVKERLLFFQGEWWEDETLGVAIPEFLANTIRSDNIDLLGKYLTSYISDTEGVLNITDSSLVYNNRELVFRCVIQTANGSASVEVNLTGLL